jgi:hypothetical protein
VHPVVWRVVLWRLVVAAAGACAAAVWISSPLSLRAFTVQVNLLIAGCYGWLAARALLTRSPAPPAAWLRGGVVVSALALSAIFFAQGGDASMPQSLLAHLITTLLVLADWLLVDRDRATLPWWLPAAWLAYPVAYLVMTLVLGAFITERWLRYQYPFLDPTRPGFAPRIAVFAALILLLGYTVLALARLPRRPT